MKTTIILARHGETEWNALGKFQGSRDICLSDRGILQAEYLKKRFENKFHHIYSSPLKRAYETASIVASSKGVTPLIADELREIDFGKWEGLTVKEIEENFPEEFKKWRTDIVEAPLCGGDVSVKMASERAKTGILEIVEKHNGENVIIVSHGGIIKAGLIGIFNWDMSMYHKMLLNNTAVNIIRFDDRLNPVLLGFNDTSHLPFETDAKSSF